MNQLLDDFGLEHSMSRRQNVKTHLLVLMGQPLQALTVGRGNDAVMCSKSQIHLAGPVFECTNNFPMFGPAQAMRSPSFPYHHSHRMVGEVKGTKTVQMRRDNSPFQESITPAQDSCSVTIDCEPKNPSQCRVDRELIKRGLLKSVGSQQGNPPPHGRCI